MDPQDKVYKDIRVYRFTTGFLNKVKGTLLEKVSIRAQNPVPIQNDVQRILGFANVRDLGYQGLAECAMDPSTPERLDLELGNRKYWMNAVLEFRGFVSGLGSGVLPTAVYVKALVLSTQPIEGQEPLAPYVGVLE